MKEQQKPLKEPFGLAGEVRGFGNYDLVRRIDVGGMGEVYLARQRTAFGREVAVKIIRSDLAYDTVARKRFLREAEVSAHLKHEHILPLFEFGEEQGRLFLVTPYIQGGTLAQRLQRGPLSYGEIHQLFTALVQAVAYIHKRGVIHRDLKPSNILLDTADDSDQVYVRLIDFGIASMLGSLASPPLTENGREIGTIEYMAPERANGISAPSNDIYSLGVILFQMLTGKLPSEARGARIAEPMIEVLKRSMAPDPGDRFASADELLQEFERAYLALNVSPEELPASLSRQETAPRPVPRAQQSEPDTKVSEPPKQARVKAVPTMPPLPKKRNVQEQIVLPREEIILPPPRGGLFDDHDAPTSSVAPDDLKAMLSNRRGMNSQPPKRRKRSLLPLLSILTVILVLVVVALSFFTFQAAQSATVTITPQVRPLNKVVTLTARTGIQNPDLASASIPLSTLTKTKTTTKTGPATGRPFLCFIKCPKVVSSEDVDNLVLQAKQELEEQLKQEMTTDLQNRGAVMVGEPSFISKDGSYEPELGKKSETVSVTLTLQGTANYYSNREAQNLAQKMLEKEAGDGFQLMPTYTKVGQPVVKNSTDSTITLAVPVAGVAKYRLTPEKLKNIQEHIKGMKVQEARTYITKQAGVDPTNVVVKVSFGEMVPAEIEQIKIGTAEPTNIPQVQLPKA